MEGLVNYSSEEDREDSPKRNVAERCLTLAIDTYRRSKGDLSRRSKEENVRNSASERSQCSTHREKDTHNGLRKSSYNEESSWSRRDSYYRSDRRSAKSYEKRRDTKDERKRRDGHRDREYNHRDIDRDRRDRSNRHRRDRHEREGRRKSSDSPPPVNKDRIHNKSRSRSASKEYPSHNKSNISSHTTEAMSIEAKQSKAEPNLVGIPSLLPPSTISPNIQTVVSLPLNEEVPKLLNIYNTSQSGEITLPKYYNPKIINPTKYAEQVQKRKLIWGSKKTEDTAAKWGHATFSEDSDGKVASKFMRLMGIKSTPKVGAPATDISTGNKPGPDVKSRQAMFSNMEQQYEVARQVTHTMRGVGLGFGSQSRQY